MRKIICLCFLLAARYSLLAQAPANDDPCNAQTLTVENLGCEPTTAYTYTSATHTAANGNTYCNGITNRDVWYKFTVPANGEATVSIAINQNTYNMAVELQTASSCNGPFTVANQNTQGFPCLYIQNNSTESRTFKNLTPGSTAFLRVYKLYDVNDGSGGVKICVSNTDALSDEPCNAGFFPVDAADPLGQSCVPYKKFSWSGATLTPAVPNPSCGVITPANIRDVWFKVRVPASGKLSINFQNDGTFNTPFLSLYNATACNGTFSEFYCGFFGTNFTNLTPNSIIYGRFYIYTSGIADNGSVKLCIADFNTVPSPNNSTKVGIGIDTPFAKLDVVGTGIFRDKLTAGSDLEVRGNLIVQGNVMARYNQNGGLKTGGQLVMDSITFNNRLGNHISLYGGLGNNNQYGFGIQSGLLQIYSDVQAANIAFGYGNSNNFTERARIENQGEMAMTLKGRLNLRPAGIYSSGLWLNNQADNSQVAFIGLAADNKVGFYGNSGLGWNGFLMNTSTGNIGLHNQNPTSAKLVIGGSAGEEGIDLSTGDQYANMRVIRNSLFAVDKDMYIGYLSGAVSSLHLYSNNNETVTVKNGNLGIANSNPAKPLSFPASLGEKILLYPGANGEVGIGVYGNELRLHSDNPGAKVSFGTQDNAGNYSENALAQRNGVYAFSVLGSLWVNGTTYASDERFKQNITSIQSPLQKLLQLNGVEYEMRSAGFPQYHFMPGRQMGLLAQNVEKVVPEAVSEQNGYKGVDYARLVPLLIESIKEQQQQIEQLKAQLMNSNLKK